MEEFKNGDIVTFINMIPQDYFQCDFFIAENSSGKDRLISCDSMGIVVSKKKSMMYDVFLYDVMFNEELFLGWWPWNLRKK